MKKLLVLILISINLLSYQALAKDDFNYVIDLNDSRLINEIDKRGFSSKLAKLYKLTNQRVIMLFASDTRDDTEYPQKAYRELQLKEKDFLIIIRKNILEEQYFFEVEFDRNFYTDPETVATIENIEEVMRNYFNAGKTYEALEFALDIVLDISQEDKVARQFQSDFHVESKDRNGAGQGNLLALMLGFIFLVFLRIMTLSGEMTTELRSKKEVHYDVFYSRQFSSSKMVSFFLIVARVLRFVGGKSFGGGASGGGGAGGKW